MYRRERRVGDATPPGWRGRYLRGVVHLRGVVRVTCAYRLPGGDGLLVAVGGGEGAPEGAGWAVVGEGGQGNGGFGALGGGDVAGVAVEVRAHVAGDCGIELDGGVGEFLGEHDGHPVRGPLGSLIGEVLPAPHVAGRVGDDAERGDLARDVHDAGGVCFP